MKVIAYLLLALFLFACAARYPTGAPAHPVVLEYRRLHALTKEFRREAQECFNMPKVPQPANATERKYREEATEILVWNPLAALKEGKTKEEIAKETDTALFLLIDSAPPYEREVAVNTVMTVRKNLPTMVCAITTIQKETSLHKQLGQARENAVLASARGELSSREHNEVLALGILIEEQLDALAKELKNRH